MHEPSEQELDWFLNKCLRGDFEEAITENTRNDVEVLKVMVDSVLQNPEREQFERIGRLLVDIQLCHTRKMVQYLKEQEEGGDTEEPGYIGNPDQVIPMRNKGVSNED